MLGRGTPITAVACGLFGTAIFALDMIAPRSVGESALYSVVVLVALRVQSRRFVLGVAVACSVLAIFGFFVSPEDGDPVTFSVASRGFALMGVWLVAGIGLSRQSSSTARDRLQRELDVRDEQFRLARKIQQRLFPKAAPTFPGFDIAGACVPADATGGDYFDFIPLSNGCLGIAIGDVSGHGFGPALLMAEAHAFIRALALVHADVGEILTQANRLVCEDTDEQFVTVLLGSLDLQERTFVYASAGQQGLLLDPSGNLTKLDSTALPLGVNPTETVPCAPAIHLDDGCFILLITDGVLEATAPDGSSFGAQRALAVLRDHREQRAERIVAMLCQAVQRFVQNEPPADDITAVVIKSQPAASGLIPTRGGALSLDAQDVEPDAALIRHAQGDQ